VNFEYVKSYYKVPAELGREIMLRDRKGIIVEDRGHYIGVTFENTQGEKIYCQIQTLP